jgi:outer membrane protein assembly factor BamE (lipoprotein component of BamABCDE complex)
MNASITRAATVALGLTVCLAGCAPRVTSHGIPATRIEQAQITPGVDTRGSVERQLGRPSSTSIADNEQWFYVSTVMESETYKARRVVDRRVFVISFDEVGLVSDFEELGVDDGVAVALRTETTPTYGREMTFAQQMFSNIGRGVPGLTQ